MFNLDNAISEWRRRMLDAGIKTPEVLDELESHLREETERQMRSGLNDRQAFETAVQQIGKAGALEEEFKKIGGVRRLQKRVKRAFFTFAGIPNHYLATPMNTSHSNIEPGWATYLKAAIFLLPAITLWAFSAVFLFPKLNQICRDARVPIPAACEMALLLTHYAVAVLVAFILALAVVEWRFGKWPRYRRAAVSIVAFLLNSAVLGLITLMVFLALIAAPALFRHAG
jgi:hypothetical protein